MKTLRTFFDEKNRDLVTDIIVALIITAAFTLFAATVLQLDSMAHTMILFSGRTVYM